MSIVSKVLDSREFWISFIFFVSSLLVKKKGQHKIWKIEKQWIANRSEKTTKKPLI